MAGERVSLGFESSDALFDRYSDAYFFPDQRRIIKPGPLRDVSMQANLLQITHQQHNEEFLRVLTSDFKLL